MEYFHRKILHKSTEILVVIKKHCPNSSDNCDDPQLPPPRSLTPPPPVSSINHSSKVVSPFLIFMFCGLAFSFLFISYLVFIKRYQRRRLRNHQINNSTHEEEDFVNEDVGPVIADHPIWLINTVGLDQSQIESIHVFKFKKGESSLIETTADCSVCLSEFEDDESLRLLPKCNHAFHVPCIDTWLRSHKNCPLCRAPIFNNLTNDQITHHATTHESNLIESTTSSETETPVINVGSETIDDHDHVVEEVENNNGETDHEKNFGTTHVDETSRVRVHSDLADHHRVQSAELLAMRRSFSNSQLVVGSKKLRPKQKLKGSSSSIHIHSKVMKSCSFGHSSSSSRKASSFTTKCAAHNRSY